MNMNDKNIKTEIRERHIGGGTDLNRLLWELAEKFQSRATDIPSEATHIGSIAIHIYGNSRLDGSIDIIQVTQNALGPSVDGKNANDALKKAALDISRNYGHELTKKQKSVIKEM